jgi:hypothetical protein
MVNLLIESILPVKPGPACTNTIGGVMEYLPMIVEGVVEGIVLYKFLMWLADY